MKLGKTIFIAVAVGVLVATTSFGQEVVSTFLPIVVAANKTVTFNNTLTFAGTDSTTMTFPSTSGNVATADSTTTFTNKTFNSSGTGNTLQVSGTTVSAGQYPGTTTNDSASAGNVGQYQSVTVASGSAVSLTTGTPATIISTNLSAGDWDLSCNIVFVSTSTTLTLQQSAPSSVNNALPAKPAEGLVIIQYPASAAGSNNVESGGPARVLLSTTTTEYCVASASFSDGTVTAYGILRARRMR